MRVTEQRRTIQQLYIIDDDAQTCHLLEAFCSQLRMTARIVSAWKDVDLDSLRKSDLLLLDLNLPDVDGLDILDMLKRSEIQTPILICSGQVESVISVASDLAKAGHLNYAGQLQKPFSFQVFADTLRNVSKGGYGKKDVNLSEQPRTLSTQQIDDIVFSAMLESHFNLVYQPQFALDDRRLVGVECLSRLTDPQWGDIAPEQFIASLERQDLMDRFTLEVIETGLKHLDDLEVEPGFKVSFNLSTTSLTENFVNQLDELMPLYKIEPAQMVLEITETAALDIRSTEPLKVLTKLRMRGYGLALDDFGTGYSTIQELNQLPVNEIKVDKSFIQTLTKRKTSDAIVSATVELALKLNYRVVAEGVETNEQAARLKQLRCTDMQGYLMSEPLTLAELSDYCKAQYARFH